ncbi:MAG TPA: Ca2+-dependent phosphoinositide-specific phospholipase C [Polyangia bacterium]|nr:Ca2+-dependent phosphoinositide-specific phospholipase C [Polyangia bacterium]
MRRLVALGMVCTGGASIGGCGKSGAATVSPADAAGGGAFGDAVGSSDASLTVDGTDHPKVDAPAADTISGADRPDGGAITGDAPDAHLSDANAADLSIARLPAVTLEALQVAGTHNSYHQAPLIAFDASHKYTQPPLDQQLAGGVRALELDVHLASDGSYDVYHIVLIDPNSSCQKLDDCLNIIATWSTAHPRHVPIFIWLEIKDDTGGSPISDLVPIEPVILKAFSRDHIITPAWLRGSHASPRERLMTDGWPTVDEARGMVMFTIINRDTRTQSYDHNGTSLDDRLMWVNAAPAEFGLPWAVITKDEEDPGDIASAHAGHLLIGVNSCAINMTDDACTTRLQTLVPEGFHMLDDDLPFQIPGRSYWLHLPAGSPGCNPPLAPLGCNAATLE